MVTKLRAIVLLCQLDQVFVFTLTLNVGTLREPESDRHNSQCVPLPNQVHRRTLCSHSPQHYVPPPQAIGEDINDAGDKSADRTSFIVPHSGTRQPTRGPWCAEINLVR